MIIGTLIKAPLVLGTRRTFPDSRLPVLLKVLTWLLSLRRCYECVDEVLCRLPTSRHAGQQRSHTKVVHALLTARMTKDLVAVAFSQNYLGTELLPTGLLRGNCSEAEKCPQNAIIPTQKGTNIMLCSAPVRLALIAVVARPRCGEISRAVRLGLCKYDLLLKMASQHIGALGAVNGR